MSISSEAKPVRRHPVSTGVLHHNPAGSMSDPLWYKSAIIYQLHVRSFCDSTGQGTGDFNGLISKLDYLADLGVTAIWLQPFYPSPQRDDGYDIADYLSVNPLYGRLEDFKRFVEESHRRSIRVITELVINHTSDQHDLFQRARRAPKGSKERNFYVWSDTTELYKDARIIFKDFERSNWTWDPVAEQYFWHRFYSHQPDLNFDNPDVRAMVLEVCDFWMRLGVDGVRLDAIPYLYERDNTSCENLPETHAFLRSLREHVETHWPGRMLLAEANQWPEDAVEYFGADNECHMAFHFPVMPRMFMALHMEDRFPIIDILEQTPAIPAGCQWAMFLRNHDELTLEMVTDEERDYMYRVYASDQRARINLGIRRRLAPLLSNNRRKIELMNAMLFSMPGTPILYYGDEIGMGDNVHLGDRNGVRTPMQWSPDRNAGFSRANPQSLFLPAVIDPEYHYETINVESQLNNPSSYLRWMKRLITLRKRYPVFGTGDVTFVQPSNTRILAFTRRDEHQTILVVMNLSRFVQPVELPLADFAGKRPVELFGKVAFPTIGKDPYFLSMGPHAFFWFLLEEGPEAGTEPAPESVPTIPDVGVDGPWEQVWNSETLRRGLERHLPAVVQSKRWFVSKARGARAATIRERVPLATTVARADAARLFVSRFEFTVGEPESYALPLALLDAASPDAVADAQSSGFVRLVNSSGESRYLVDALTRPDVARKMLHLALTGEEMDASGVRIAGKPTDPKAHHPSLDHLDIKSPKLEQSNSTIFFEDKYVLKMFRRIDDGENPESEIGRHLTKRTDFRHIAPLVGSVELQSSGAPRTLAVVLKFIGSKGDAWSWAVERAAAFLAKAASLPESALASPNARLPAELVPFQSEIVEPARLLAVRTAELHAALGTDAGDPAFTPEPFTPMYQRASFQSIRNSIRNAHAAVARGFDALPVGARALAEAVLRSEPALSQSISDLRQGTLSGRRIRIHGDYHLGQVLYTGTDFIIIDFEGEPLRSISERRIKRTPLRDAAGMLRSFDYAAWAALDRLGTPPTPAQSDAARAWTAWTTTAFKDAYLKTMAEKAPTLLGPDRAHHELLLRAWLLEKACYEVVYELNSRPAWAHIPLRALVAMLPAESSTTANGGNQ